MATVLASTLLSPIKSGSDVKNQPAQVIYKAPKESKAVEKAPPINIEEIKEIVNEAGKEFHINPNLILAVIKSESDFNPNAMGSKGEIGLMQILPSNTKYTLKQLKDPKTNIFVGAGILKDDIRQFKSIGIALEAYNAGNSKVIKNEIPKSTRSYVKNTLKNYGAFLRKYNWIITVICILHFYPQIIIDHNIIKVINWMKL